MQVPALRPVTVPPLRMQTLVVMTARLTERPEVAIALTAPVPPTRMLGAVPKLMVWLPIGVTGLDAAEAGPLPTVLLAVTVKV